jgi:Carboxypeptidase regulatory-like domain/TonB dependent receptor/TonB-dependent Receptor Plug Domain
MARAALSMRFLLISAVLVFVSTLASAQYGASLEGTVSDKSGAVISGAAVTVTNQATGVSRSTVTSDAGFYRIPGLTPGKYRVDVVAASFKRETTSDVQVGAESTRGLNVVLTPGGTQETVTVSAEGAALETENASVTGSIGAQQVEELPSFGRDPYELLRLAPGVFGDGARSSNATASFLPNAVGAGGSANSIYQVENQPQISANGQRATENNFMIDGVDVNSLTNGGAAVVSPTEESIAEITVLSGSYSAEDGRNSGAQIKVISKSGTNSIHGSGFFKYDEPGLNAFNKFGGFQGNFVQAPPVRVDNKLRNYGGSIGGPILKNKLFFFFAYEGEHVFNQSFGINYIETPQFIQAVTAANPNSIAAAILTAPGTTPRVAAVLAPSCNDVNRPATDTNGNPTCQVVAGGLDLGSPYPAGTGPGNPYLRLGATNPTPPQMPQAFFPGAFVGGGLDGIPDVELAQLFYPVHRTGDQYNARVDWTINSKHTLSASTYLTNSTSTNPPGSNQTSAPNRDVVNKPFSPAGTVLWNWVVSPTKLNEARLNFSRFAFNEVTSNKGIVNWGIPDVEIQDVFNSGRRIWFGAPQGSNTPGILAQNTYGFGDTFSWALSKHSLKFGFQYRKEQNNNNEVGFARPLFTFSQLWNFANDAPIFEQNAVNPNTGNPDGAQRYFRTSYYGGFVEDDWKVRSNLTLNVGLRYEYYSPLSEPQGLLSNLVLAGSGPNAISNATLITGKTVYSTPKTNFAPRFGFAWSPDKYNQKVVFRGGFGMYYDGVPAAVFDPARENPPFHALQDNCCGTSGLEGFGSPFDQNSSGQPLIIYALGSSDSPLSYPGNPALGGGIGPNGFPKNCCVQVYFEPQHFRIPYVYGYSFETQVELPARMIFTLGYQGSDSHHLVRIFDGNQVYDGPVTNSNPNFYIKPDVTANYHSLNTRLEHRFSRGVQAAFKYRYSKSLDEVSFGQPDSSVNETYPRVLRSEYGPSDFDATHFMVLSGIWDLPIFHGKQEGVAKLLGGWQLSGIFTYHSGFPWTPVNNNCLETPGQQFICPIRPTGYSGGAGTDYSNSTFLTPNGNFPGGGAKFFTLTPPAPPGVGRNSFRGPRYESIDLTFGKNTPLSFLGEGGSLQIRMNVFNVFNHLNLSPFTFNTRSTIVQDQFFGTAGDTAALAGRVVELQARISF